MVGRATGGLGAKLALLGGSILVLLALGEIAARVVHARRAAAGVAGVPDAEDLPVIEDLYDLVQKNVRGIHRGVYYRTNDRGLRGPDYARAPADGTFRILVSGDSVTMGSGVREEDAYPHALGALLNAGDTAGRRYEVLNLGVSGINATWATTRLVRLSDYYRADLVVYGFTINDIQGPHYRQLLGPEDAESVVAVWRRVQWFRDSPSHLLRELWPRLMSVVEWEAFHAGPDGIVGDESAVWHLNYFENPAAWRDVADALARLAHHADERGICGLVFVHTYLAELGDDHPFDPFYRKVGDEARSLGLYVVQSLPAFRGRDPSSLWVERFDSHPNAEGHALLARALHDGLRELPPACWRTAAERRAGRATASSPAGSRSSEAAR